MTMKKFSILLAAVAMMAMTACNEKPAKGSDESNNAAATEQVDQTQKQAPTMSVEKAAPTKDGKDHTVADFSTKDYQIKLENMCWKHGDCKQTAPAQRMADFVAGRKSHDLPKASYAPGLAISPVYSWLPQFISGRLRKGFAEFGKRSKGFLTNDAVVIAVETRTSAPVRILRDSATLQHVRLEGLFPCGEGAGYAGGIVSAAVDGERCAAMCAQFLGRS